jgi:hypothetical protein
LVLRAAALTDRWEEVLAKVREELARDRELSWAWESPGMVAELKAEILIRPPGTQGEAGQGDEEVAAYAKFWPFLRALVTGAEFVSGDDTAPRESTRQEILDRLTTGPGPPPDTPGSARPR